jgi:hypothetical protein
MSRDELIKSFIDEVIFGSMRARETEIESLTHSTP